VIRPKQLEWFAVHGEYAQCLYTRNLPNNRTTDPDVREAFPVTNLEPHDRAGMTAKAIFGPVNIDVSLPFAIATHAYDGPQGHGFIGQVWVKYEGTIYTKAKNYGPESHWTFDWTKEEPALPVLESLWGRLKAGTASQLPTFLRMGRWVRSQARRIRLRTRSMFRRT
jgi:hypothetical protein